MSSDALDLKTPPVLSTADEHDNDQSIINNEPTVTTKRQRSVSPRSTVCHTSRSPPQYNKGAKSTPETMDSSDLDEPADDDIQSKRRRFSAPLGGRTTLDRHKEGSRRSTSSISDEEDGTLHISVDSKPVSTARTISPASDSAPLAEPQLAAQVIDDSQDWEVRQIIGKQDVDGVPHYLVVWFETLVPEHALGNAKELVDEFEARLRTRRGVNNGRVRDRL